MIEITSDAGRIASFCWHNSNLQPSLSIDWPGSGRWLVIARWGFCTLGSRCLTRGGWFIQAKPDSADAWAW